MDAKYYNIYRASYYGDCLDKMFTAYCDEVTIDYLIEHLNETEKGVYFALEDGVKIFGEVEDKTDG